MERPTQAEPSNEEEESMGAVVSDEFADFPPVTTISSRRVEPPLPIFDSVEQNSYRKPETRDERQRRLHKQIILRVLQHVRFIADHFRELEDEQDVRILFLRKKYLISTRKPL